MNQNNIINRALAIELQIYTYGFEDGKKKENKNPYLTNSTEFMRIANNLYEKGYKRGLKVANILVSFAFDRSSNVKIYINDTEVDSISLIEFTRIYEKHDKFSKNPTNDDYFELFKLWYGKANELACEYYNRIDQNKLDVLKQVEITFYKLEEM